MKHLVRNMELWLGVHSASGNSERLWEYWESRLTENIKYEKILESYWKVIGKCRKMHVPKYREGKRKEILDTWCNFGDFSLNIVHGFQRSGWTCLAFPLQIFTLLSRLHLYVSCHLKYRRVWKIFCELIRLCKAGWELRKMVFLEDVKCACISQWVCCRCPGKNIYRLKIGLL